MAELTHIKPLAHVTRDEVRLMARAAADRGESLAAANVFAIGSAHHRHFEQHFLERERALGESGS